MAKVGIDGVDVRGWCRGLRWEWQGVGGAVRQPARQPASPLASRRNTWDSIQRAPPPRLGSIVVFAQVCVCVCVSKKKVGGLQLVQELFADRRHE